MLHAGGSLQLKTSPTSSSSHAQRHFTSSSSSSSWQQQQRRRPHQQQQQQQQRLAVRVQSTAPAAEDPVAAAREARMGVTRRIKALGEARRFKEAVQELASLAELGVEPDTQAATALLAACTHSRDMKTAEAIFEQLFGDFLVPDEVTFAVLLRGYGSRSPPDWQSVDAVLTRMKANYGLEPTAVSFNALLEICAKSNDSDRALDVLDRMAGDSVEPNDFTWQLVAKKRTWRSYMAKLFVDGAA